MRDSDASLFFTALTGRNTKMRWFVENRNTAGQRAFEILAPSMELMCDSFYLVEVPCHINYHFFSI